MRRTPTLPLLLLVVVVLASGLVPTGLLLRDAQAAPAETPDPLTPHESSEAVKKELTDIIDAQLTAFRADDYSKAYGYASHAVREMFPPADFATMVKAGYPVIAHSTTAEYGLTFDTGEKAVVNVRIGNAANHSAEYQYLLQKEDGVWKIGGVSELKSNDLSV